MKIAQLNSSCGGSPGMLMRTLSQKLQKSGHECRVYYTFGTSSIPDAIKYSSDIEVKVNALASRITGNYGFVSDVSTKRLIRHLEEYQPDLIQIHTIHGHDLNCERFFGYISEKRIPLVYTFHDAWAFTGYCAFYDSIPCEQWKTACQKCPVYRRYSWFRDQSRVNFLRKQSCLCSLENLTIITPSRWLKEEAGKTFLKSVPCRVIPNGIDTGVFHPKESRIKEKLGIEGKKMVLGIALSMSKLKGIDDLIALSGILPEDHQLVLVGVPEKMRKELPDTIIACQRTDSREALAEYYSAADVMVNPTHGDNFPTVNLEALACGTPVVTYDVGGSPEAIDSETGIVVNEGDLSELKEAAVQMAHKKPEISDACRNRAVRLYDQEVFAKNYIDLYQQILTP